MSRAFPCAVPSSCSVSCPCHVCGRQLVHDGRVALDAAAAAAGVFDGDFDAKCTLRGHWAVLLDTSRTRARVPATLSATSLDHGIAIACLARRGRRREQTLWRWQRQRHWDDTVARDWLVPQRGRWFGMHWSDHLPHFRVRGSHSETIHTIIEEVFDISSTCNMDPRLR